MTPPRRKTVAIVQARMSSTRLPGKVMLPLASEPVLRHVLRRCQAIAAVDEVVCAVPDDDASRSIETEAAGLGVATWRGSETDVLDRYRAAAEATGADRVLRVTSDCPLIDPAVCDQVIGLLDDPDVAYACNNMPRSFPHGLDCEAFTMPVLSRAAATATAADEREHVTPWMRRHPDVVRANQTCPVEGQSRRRWTLDRPADYRFLAAVFEALPAGRTDWRAVIDVISANPDLQSLQQACLKPEEVST